MSEFEAEFLENYLKFGLGALPKSDTDALVMHLLDRYGYAGYGPLATRRNQEASEILKTPVSKIKKLRYEAALKFGESIEEQAKGRLLAALSQATLEIDDNKEKINLIIEDSLAKNWLQGQLKSHQLIFDHSFNTEIVKVTADGLFAVLDTIFSKKELDEFRSAYDSAKKLKTAEERRKAFKQAASKFAQGAAKQAGSGVVAVLKAQLGMA